MVCIDMASQYRYVYLQHSTTVQECQTDLVKPPVCEKVTKVKLLFGLLSPMDREMVKTLEDRNFQEYLLRMANKYEN